MSEDKNKKAKEQFREELEIDKLRAEIGYFNAQRILAYWGSLAIVGSAI